MLPIHQFGWGCCTMWLFGDFEPAKAMSLLLLQFAQCWLNESAEWLIMDTGD
jgi:hypothetical protein